MEGRGALDWVLRYLRQLEPITVTEAEDRHFDLTISLEAGREQRFDLKNMPTLSQEKAEKFLAMWKPRSPRISLLFAVAELAPRTRQFLRDHRASWVERDTGVCHILAPGIYIDTQIPGVTPSTPSTSPTRLRDRTGQIAEALLLANPKTPIRLAAIVKEANVSAALVSRVFQRLTAAGLLEEQGAGPNRTWSLADVGALLDLWSKEERQPETVTNLYVWSRSVHALYEKLPQLHQLKFQWAVAGPAAAYLYAPILTAPPQPAIYIDTALPAQTVAQILGGEIADKGGNLQVWQSKGNPALYQTRPYEAKAGSAPVKVSYGSVNLVSKPRAYIETINATGRSPEVAQAIREQMLKEFNG